MKPPNITCLNAIGSMNFQEISPLCEPTLDTCDDKRALSGDSVQEYLIRQNVLNGM